LTDTSTSSLGHVRYLLPADSASTPETLRSDVVVYGATAGGVAAAYRAALQGRSVALLVFGDHIGGMTTGGLGYTDVGNRRTIGGLALDFYRAVAGHYGTDAPEWFFEPHVADTVLRSWLEHPLITVVHRQQLRDVEITGAEIRTIWMRDGRRYEAGVFIDASYEGDLMAGAGVTYFVGREDSSVYDEPLAGAQHDRGHQFGAPVDPYVVPGEPASGLLPGIDPQPFGAVGTGDDRVQAYNFRLAVTTAPDRVPFPRPAGYAPERYELLLRYVLTGEFELAGRLCLVHGDVYDLNNHGAVSSDHIGGSAEWPDASFERRQEIFDDHVAYQSGLLYFLANDPRVPERVRAEARRLGLSPREFTGSDFWPPQLYVREARRMVGDRVVTQHDALDPDAVDDPVALASYTMDSHHVRRYVENGRVVNEGNVQQEVHEPFGISYRSIVPKRDECTNLFVIAAISASHVAYSSTRMEPVFMMLGDAAATAADIALSLDSIVQDVDYPMLEAALLEHGAILRLPAGAAAGIRETGIRETGIRENGS
jgi:hypothetical protein